MRLARNRPFAATVGHPLWYRYRSGLRWPGRFSAFGSVAVQSLGIFLTEFQRDPFWEEISIRGLNLEWDGYQPYSTARTWQVCCENPECNSEHPVECGPPAIATLTSVSTTNA